MIFLEKNIIISKFNSHFTLIKEGFNPPENIIKFGMHGKLAYSGYFVIGTDLFFQSNGFFYTVKNNDGAYNYDTCSGKAIKSSAYSIEYFMDALPWLTMLSEYPIKLVN